MSKWIIVKAPSTERATSNLNIDELQKNRKNLDLSKTTLTKDDLEKLQDYVNNSSTIGYIKWGNIYSGTNKYQSAIENKLIENNKNFQRYPTDFTHALLSAHIYENSQAGQEVRLVTKLGYNHSHHLKDWKVEAVYQPRESNDYYSALYVNSKCHQAVLAHRGLNIIGSITLQHSSLYEFLSSTLNQNIGTQQAAAYVCTAIAIERVKKLSEEQNTKYHLSTTGHGFGGWLAELGVHFGWRHFEYPEIKAVTFDSPGIGTNVKSYKSNVRNKNTGINTDLYDIVSYLSAPNVMNACNTHIGEKYRLDISESNSEEIKETLPKKFLTFISKQIIGEWYLQSLMQISNKTLSSMIEVFDPITGKPYPDKYIQILNWPHITHKSNPDTIPIILKEICLDNIPFIQLLPNSWKESSARLVKKLVPSSTYGIMVCTIASFVSGNTSMAQLWDAHRYFNAQKERDDQYKLVPSQKTKQEYELLYKGCYETKKVNSRYDKLLTSTYSGPDFYLKKLAKYQEEKIKQLDNISQRQLMLLKNIYITINQRDGMYIAIKEDSPITIEQLKEQIVRLVEVNPVVKELLEKNITPFAGILSLEPQERLADNIIVTNTNFIARPNVIEQITEALKFNHIIAISACAGTGKTNMALQYAELMKDYGIVVRWMNASTIEKDYLELALELKNKNLKETLDNEQDRVNTYNEWKEEIDLINFVNHTITTIGQEILIIFDDLDDYAKAEKYLINLPQNLVKVIITTRNNNLLQNDLQHITLEPFTSQQAIEYVTNSKLRQQPNKDNISELVQILSSKNGEVLPYKLKQAIAHLQTNTAYTMQNYVKDLKNNVNKSTKIPTLIKNLKDYPVELQILQYAAFLDPTLINKDIFKEIFHLTDEQLQKSIIKLEEESLMKLIHMKNDDNVYLSMPTVIQDDIIQYIDNFKSSEPSENTVYIVQKLLETFNQLMPYINFNNKDNDLAPSYYSHIERLLNNYQVETTLVHAELYEKIANYSQYKLFNETKALEYYQQANQIYQNLGQSNNVLNQSSIARISEKIGGIYLSRGDFENIIKYYEQALIIYQKLHSDNLTIISCLETLVIASAEIGKIDEAINYKDQIITIYKNIYKSSNHVDIAKAIKDKAAIYNKFRHIESQMLCEEEYLKVYTNCDLGEKEYFSCAQSMSTLGERYKKLNKLESSIRCHEQALSYYTLAFKCRDLIDAEENKVAVAQAKKEGSLIIPSMPIKYNHPEVAFCVKNLAECHKSLGHNKQSLLYYEQALKIFQNLYQDKIKFLPNIYIEGISKDILKDIVADILSEIALSYYELGNHYKALELFRQSYYSKVNLFGEDDEKTRELNAKIISLDFEKVDLNEPRITILRRGVVDNNIITIRQQISSTLDNIYNYTKKNQWYSKIYKTGVKKYISDEHITQELGNINNTENLHISKMLCFEAICLGAMSTKSKNNKCINKFINIDPTLFNEILLEHPEYMVDGAIVKEYVTDARTVTDLLGEQLYESNTNI